MHWTDPAFAAAEGSVWREELATAVVPVFVSDAAMSNGINDKAAATQNASHSGGFPVLDIFIRGKSKNGFCVRMFLSEGLPLFEYGFPMQTTTGVTGKQSGPTFVEHDFNGGGWIQK